MQIKNGKVQLFRSRSRGQLQSKGLPGQQLIYSKVLFLAWNQAFITQYLPAKPRKYTFYPYLVVPQYLSETF